MAVATLSNFQSGSLYIPNNNNLNTEIVGVPNSGSDLQLFIDIYDRELWLNALGVTLYNEFEPQIDNPTIQKWVDLLDGKDYTIGGKTYRWEGLRGSNSQCLSAFYIYCQYLRNNQSLYTTGGVVLTDSANSVNVDPTPKYIFNYNKFITKYQGELSDHSGNNPNIIINASGNIGLDYYGSSRGNFANMYQYMTDQNTLDPTTFPDFEFKFYYRENSFGI